MQAPASVCFRPGMQPLVTVALIVASAMLGALLGVLLAGPLGAIAGVIPPTAVASWQASLGRSHSWTS